MGKKICGIIVGEALSVEEAGELAEKMKNCPFLVASGTTVNRIYSIYIVPEEKKWWLKYPEVNPKETGVEKALVYIVENVSYPEEINLKLPKKKTEIPPCGANCQTCPLVKEYGCNGCPATTSYERMQ